MTLLGHYSNVNFIFITIATMKKRNTNEQIK